jgi:hypothetical protein
VKTPFVHPFITRYTFPLIIAIIWPTASPVPAQDHHANSPSSGDSPPVSTPAGAAPDGFVLGPALGGVVNGSKKLEGGGLFSQNVFWSNAAAPPIKPIVAYQLGDGCPLNAGDLQIVVDWEDSRWTNVPLGFPIGKGTKRGTQPVRFTLNPQYNFNDDPGLPKWSFTFTSTALFPSF